MVVKVGSGPMRVDVTIVTVGSKTVRVDATILTVCSEIVSAAGTTISIVLGADMVEIEKENAIQMRSWRCVVGQELCASGARGAARGALIPLSQKSQTSRNATAIKYLE